ncbi:MAG: nucleotidyltransferase domain-containing protein [Nanoarchaeota archaeon]
MKSNNLIAYAMDFASFLIQNIDDKEKINSVLLFGSTAREDFSEESDIDIFIDTKNKEMEKVAEEILSKFQRSIKYTKYWKLLGIANEISLKTGELEKWELKESIISDGIVLYGKYLPMTKMEAKPYVIFELKIKGNRRDKIRIWRKIYGYTQKVNEKSYESRGLVREYDGKKIGKATFIIPLEHIQRMAKYLSQNKVLYSTYKIWSNTIQ